MSDPNPIADSLAVAATTIQKFKQSPSTKRALYLVQAAQRSLDRAKTFEDCKDIHDALRLLEVYSQARRDDWRTSQTFVMQRLITEWKMGGILRDTVNHEGGRPGKQSLASTVLPDSISRNDSSNWQRIAELDVGELKTLMQAVFDTEELSTAWAVRQWQKLHGHISIHDDGDETPHHAPPVPDNFGEDHLYPDFGSRMKGLLNECQDAHDEAVRKHPDLAELFAELDKRIVDLFEEMK